MNDFWGFFLFAAAKVQPGSTSWMIHPSRSLRRLPALPVTSPSAPPITCSDSEPVGAPRPRVFSGCVFSYYSHPPYRTPSEPVPLFNDVSVLLPQSVSSLLTSWLPLSLLFLWRRPSELNIAEVPSQRICWLPKKKGKKKKLTFLSRHPITHKVGPNSKPGFEKCCISLFSWVPIGGDSFICTEWRFYDRCSIFRGPLKIKVSCSVLSV